MLKLLRDANEWVRGIESKSTEHLVCTLEHMQSHVCVCCNEWPMKQSNNVDYQWLRYCRSTTYFFFSASFVRHSHTYAHTHTPLQHTQQGIKCSWEPRNARTHNYSGHSLHVCECKCVFFLNTATHKNRDTHNALQTSIHHKMHRVNSKGHSHTDAFPLYFFR